MASLNENILGLFRGKIGNIVARKFNGKQVISVRPHNYRKNKSLKSQAERSKFSRVVNFAKYINSIPYLKSVWNQSCTQGFSAYHKIIKANLLLTTDGQLGESNIIVPASPNSLQINYTLQSNNIECEVLQFQNFLSENASGQYTLQFIFVFSYSLEPQYAPNKICGCTYYFNPQLLRNNPKMIFSLSGEVARLVSQYKKCTLYSTILWRENLNSKIYWSTTCYKTFVNF
jgi:hypothetical protein